MRLLGLVIGGVVFVASALILAVPEWWYSVGRSLMTQTGLDVIAAFRIAAGLVFVLAAPASRAPRSVRALGVAVIVAGFVTPWFGVARSLAVLTWWASTGPLLMRLDACLGLILGGLIVFVFRGPTRQAT
jgi:hypothetical protein